MRAFTVALLLVVVAACSAFAPVGSRTAAPVSKIALSMANDEVEDIATPEILPDASDAPKKNIVKNIPRGEVREVKWVDDAPTANVSFAMSWGYLFVVFPGVLFLNDIFHIVPKGTLGIF
mmetsp:Transcript_6814/g.16223  ORF Transcript_6814/g.16223 Transcript_6814/m.16223 type:complete len:120 (-) Transcript_6814:240-599(-)